MYKPNAFKIPLQLITPTGILFLLGYSPVYEYVNGKKTETVKNLRYEVVNPEDFEKFYIKTENLQPIISEEELKKNGHVKVTAINFVGTFYRTESDWNFTSKADKLEVIKQ